MKIFEVEFVYDDWNTARNADVGSRKNPFRVRMMYPRDKEYDNSYWSYNHRVMRDEFERVHNPKINGSTYERKYYIQAIRRVR